MQEVLYPLTVNQEYGGVVKHFGQRRNVVFLNSFASISQLEFSLWVGLLAHFAKYDIGEWCSRADDNLGSEVADRFDDIAVYKKRP